MEQLCKLWGGVKEKTGWKPVTHCGDRCETAL